MLTFILIVYILFICAAIFLEESYIWDWQYFEWREPWDFRRCSLLIPIVRKVFPQLLVDDIVAVQPMAKPTGEIFSLRYKQECPQHGSIIWEGHYFRIPK